MAVIKLGDKIYQIPIKLKIYQKHCKALPHDFWCPSQKIMIELKITWKIIDTSYFMREHEWSWKWPQYHNGQMRRLWQRKNRLMWTYVPCPFTVFLMVSRANNSKWKEVGLLLYARSCYTLLSVILHEFESQPWHRAVPHLMQFEWVLGFRQWRFTIIVDFLT